MLECRLYQYEELSKYLKTTNPQGTERKLENYGVEFSKRGVGLKSTYNITAINEPFKVFAVFDLGVDPRTDFRKLAYFIYLVLNDEEFNGMGAEMMEEYSRNKPFGMSRQTISKYLNLLEDHNLISLMRSDCVYYRVYKKLGVQTHEIVSRKEYADAWKIYWDCINKGYDTRAAFQSMYNKFGGAPRKHPTIGLNVFYKDVLDWLSEILENDFGNIE